jgi:hypothetical protein
MTYLKIKSLLLAILIPALVFIAIDIFATEKFWYFNSKYILGLYLFNLPIEEALPVDSFSPAMDQMIDFDVERFKRGWILEDGYWDDLGEWGDLEDWID